MLTAIRSKTPYRIRVLEGLNRISRSNLMMVGLLFLLHTLAKPYFGFQHDARLYQLQVLNQATDGGYGQDLFLAYGSQDSYSLFSFVMSPLAKLLGIKLSFLLGYHFFFILLLWAEVQLAKCLIRSTTLRNLGLILLSVSSIPYGYWVLSIHEPFLTGRTPAHAFSILALSLFLNGRSLWALTCCLVAMAFHPLIGFGPLLIGTLYWASNRFSIKQMLQWMAIGVAAAVVALLSPIGDLLFRRMEADWMYVVWTRNPMCFLTTWYVEDGLRTTIAMFVAAFGCLDQSRKTQRLVAASIGIGIAGVVVNGIAEFTSFAFLLQGQAIRSIWVTHLLAVPLGICAVRRLWSYSNAMCILSGGLILLFLGNRFLLGQDGGAVLPMVLAWWTVATVAWCFVFAPRQVPNIQKWKLASLAGLVAMCVVVGIVGAVKLIGMLPSSERVIWSDINRMFTTQPELVWVCVGLMIAGWLGTRRVDAQSFVKRFAPLAAALTLTVGQYAFTQKCVFSEMRKTKVSNTEFAQQFISPSSGKSQVYWPIRLSEVWIDLQSSCYYDCAQLAGTVFSEETALEALRRAKLVRRFEVAEFKRHFPREWQWKSFELNLGCNKDVLEPTVDDLLALSQDPLLDWIVLADEYPGLYTATNGSVYIYNCQQIRERLGQADQFALAK